MDNEIKNLFIYLESELKLNRGVLTEFAEQYAEYIAAKASTEGTVVKKEYSEAFASIADAQCGEAGVYLRSVVYSLDKSASNMNALLETAYRDRELLGVNNMISIFQQSSAEVFVVPDADTPETYELRAKIHRWTVERYASSMENLLSPITFNKRKKGFVIVLTDQQIDYSHGPSKSSVDRCKILTDQGYSVLLIDTAELLAPIGTFHLYETRTGGYKEESLDYDHLEWKGTVIPYFQCEQNTPNPRTAEELLSTIRNLAPEFVVAIGGTGILMSLVSKIIPTLCVGMCPSELSISEIPYQTFSGIHDETFNRQMNILGLSEDRIIDSVFGSSIKVQTCKHSRSEFSISDDVFLIAVVGGRLSTEADEAFMKTIDRIHRIVDRAEFMFIGDYVAKEPADPDYRAYVHATGMVDDVLSYLEICDLYINPIRRGGGTSCVEAMSKGLPVVTTPFGDVAVNAGGEFQVKDYDQFLTAVEKYCTDEAYYSLQSEKALKRALRLLNAEEDFMKTVNDFRNRAVFR